MLSRQVCNDNGEVFFIEVEEYEGRPRKTKQSHPYSYDPIILWTDGSDTLEPTDSVYTDRLYQWDYKKHNTLCQKHFKNEGQYWDRRNPELIQAFLRDYLDNPNLVLTKIIEYCNVSNGYPVWRFDFAHSV